MYVVTLSMIVSECAVRGGGAGVLGGAGGGGGG
jgi:hypothetical protein